LRQVRRSAASPAGWSAHAAQVAEEGSRVVAGSRRTWTRIAARGATAAAFAAALGGLAGLLHGGDLDRSVKIASVAGMFISLAGLAIAAASL
jgi:hypothetical protein